MPRSNPASRLRGGRMKVTITEIVTVLCVVVVLIFVVKEFVIPSVKTLITCNDTVVRGVFKLECIKVK